MHKNGGRMKSGPQRYPGASTAYWYQTRYGGDSMESNVIVWHSTEGTSLPTYDGGSMAPNFTAVPNFTAKRLDWFQHFDFDVSSRALVHSGAVATNTLNVCQVEIVGTCDPATHLKWAQAGYQHLYMPELPDWAIRDLGAFTKWAHDNHGVPLASGLAFKAYPASYGTSNGVRMTNSQWLNFEGHCGHQHVPSGNVHGDPGAFPMAVILTAAKGGTTTPPEDDMQLSDQINLGDWIPKQWPTDKGLADKKIPVDVALGSGYAHARKAAENSTAILTKLDALTAVNSELVKTVATLAAGIGDLDPAAIVTELKTAIESINIHLDVPNA
jgi:hypothetical protein